MPNYICSKGKKNNITTKCTRCGHDGKTSIPCHHLTLVPYEIVAGKRTWTDKKKVEAATIDWHSNIINAHYLRVTKYYCPECQQVIPIKGDS